MKLTKTEFAQIREYIEDRQREGWYYGNKKHFEKREKRIIEWLSQEEERTR